MCVSCVRSESRKRSWRGGGSPATFGFEAQAAQLPSSPPPRTSPCLSPSLGASRVGCGPCPTCRHAALRGAEECAGGAATRARRGREAQGMWREVKRTKTEHWCNDTMEKRGKTKQNCSLGRDDAADGGDKRQRGWRSTRASRGAVQALESDDEEQGCRQRG